MGEAFTRHFPRPLDGFEGPCRWHHSGVTRRGNVGACLLLSCGQERKDDSIRRHSGAIAQR
jgi:hypothetical protein